MKETICTVAGLVGGFIATLLGGFAPGASLHRMEELHSARQEMNRTKDEAV